MELILDSGQALDLSQLQLQMNLVSPLFSTEILSGSYVFPFDLDNTPSTAFALGLPHVVDVVNVERDYPVTLDTGTLQMPARLRVMKATPDKVRCSLLLATGRIADQLKNTKLTDLDLVYDVDPDSYRPHLDLTLTGISSPVPDWVQLRIYRTRSGSTDIDKHFRYQVPWQGSVNATLARLATRYATAKPIRTWNAGTTYNNFPWDYVTDGSAYFRSKANGNVGNPLPPTMTPDPWWTRYPTLNDFLNNWFFDPAGENEDHPLDQKDITLEMIATDTLRIWDDSYGSPWKLDFILIPNNSLVDPPATGSWSQLLQNIDPAPVFDINVHANALMSSTYPGAKHVFFPIYNPNVLDDIPSVKHINYFRRVSASDQAAWALQYRAIAPAIYVWYVFDEAMKQLGLLADKSFLDDVAYSDWKQLVMQSEANMIQLFNNIVNNQNERPIESLDLSLYVPAISLGDFLKIIRSTLQVEIVINLLTNTVRLEPVKGIATKAPDKNWTAKRQSKIEKDHEPHTGFTMGWVDPDQDAYWKSTVKSLANERVLAEVANIAALPSVADMGDVRFVTSEQAYYRYVNDGVLPAAWVFWSWPQMDLSIGVGGAERRSAAAPVLMYRGQDQAVGAPVGRLWLIPQMHQPLIDKIKGDNQQFTTVRLLLYKGLHTGSDGWTYPLATSADKNYSGTVIGNRVLSFRGAKGLYELDLKEFLNMLLNGRYISFDLLLDELDLLNLSLDDVVYIDGIFCVLENIRMTLPASGKSVATFLAKK